MSKNNSMSEPLTKRHDDIVWLFYNKTGNAGGVTSYFAKFFKKHPDTIRNIIGEKDDDVLFI